jgi:hypothetical protein
MPVREVAAELGIDHRLSHPDLLVAAVWRWDDELAQEWRPPILGAAVEYAVHLPTELAPYYVAAAS